MTVPTPRDDSRLKDAVAQAEGLEEVVGLCVGAASTCWEDLSGTGVFDDQRAAEIVDVLVEWVRAQVWWEE